MSDAEQDDARELADAATVHAAREEIVRALGPLAAQPLSERAAEQMRRALERADTATVRRAVRRLSVAVPETGRPALASVPTVDGREAGSAPPAGRVLRAGMGLAVPVHGGAA